MWKEFKEFIAKGNILDLAVGMVMGAAFTAIVNSLVNDIISPFIGLLIGKADFSQLVIKIGTAEVMLGNFINAVISFLIIALVLFFVIKGLNSLQKLSKKQEEEATAEEEAEETAPSKEEVLLTEIRDLLRNK